MTNYLLDCSAILAFVLDEPGAVVVRDNLPGAAASTVNLAETVAKLVEWGAPEGAARRRIAALQINAIPFDLVQAERSGELRRVTKVLGLSLADRACLAVAQILAMPILTSDRDWAKLDIGVEVRLIR
jgi:ribonuclease VapC